MEYNKNITRDWESFKDGGLTLISLQWLQDGDSLESVQELTAIIPELYASGRHHPDFNVHHLAVSISCGRLGHPICFERMRPIFSGLDIFLQTMDSVFPVHSSNQLMVMLTTLTVSTASFY